MSRVNIDSTLLGVGTRGGGGGKPGRIGTGEKKAASGSSKRVGSGRNRGKTHITILNILQSRKQGAI